jgi:hypothetical protein
MVEYVLRVHLKQKICKWAKGLLQPSSEKNLEDNEGEMTDESTTEKTVKKESGEVQPKNVAEATTGLATPEDGSRRNRPDSGSGSEELLNQMRRKARKKGNDKLKV